MKIVHFPQITSKFHPYILGYEINNLNILPSRGVSDEWMDSGGNGIKIALAFINFPLAKDAWHLTLSQ